MGKIPALILIALLGAAVYVGMVYGALWLDFARLRDKVEIEARHATIRDDEEIKAAILERAEELGIPLKPRNIKIERRRGVDITIKVRYRQDLVLPGYRRRLIFSPEASAPLR
jgi:hypothetical protein